MDKSGINIKKNLPEGKGEKSGVSNVDKPECAVCLQVCVQPVQLPCRHIFCYLCVKGVTHQSKRCAMCRQEIPANYLDNPVLVQSPEPIMHVESDYEWFYEGRNGWWQYDERTSLEIESAYQKGEKQCEVLIAGFLYVIDFGEWYQYRRSDPFRQRRVKRDFSTIPKKGVAGIRVVSDPVQVQGAHGNVSVRTDQNSTSNAEETVSSEAENTLQSDGELSTQTTGDSENADHATDANTSESTENRTCEVDSAQEVRRAKTRTKRK